MAELSDEDLYISVLTVGEIAKGIALFGAGRKRRALASWLNGLETKFGDRILAIDTETGRLWGELEYAPGRRSCTTRFYDGKNKEFPT